MSPTLFDIPSAVLGKAVGQITSFQDYVNQQVDRFIVRPGTARGISGFVFNVRDDERLELRAEVTDYVVEDNTYKNDHIAIKPMVITLRGFMGEVQNEVETGVQGLINTLEQKLTTVSEYLPVQSLAAIQKAQRGISRARDFVTNANNAIRKTENLIETISLTPIGATKQEQAFNKIMSMFRGRQIVTVETPWGYFDNMAITNVVMEQDGKTKQWSDIIITMKQMQFAGVEEASLSSSGRAAEMVAAVKSKGKVKGTAVTSAATAPFSQAVAGPQKSALTATLGN